MTKEEIHILVIFSCNTGAVEQLALAAAVGAVQARAAIRLRRIVDNSPGESNENTQRLDQDYVAPRQTDAEWADGFILAVPDPLVSKVHQLGVFSGKPSVSLLVESVTNRDTALLLGRRVVETARDWRVSNHKEQVSSSTKS
jgi:hypothetical protein